MRVLAAGDRFVAPELFESALRAAIPDELTIAHLATEWPIEPWGPIGSGDSVVHEACGSTDDLAAALDGARVAITHVSPFTAPVFEACPDLEMVAVCRGGPVNVDLGAADRAGVAVTSAPGRNTAATSEFAIGLMLASMRRIPLSDAELKAGRWRGDFYAYAHAGLELEGTTVGLVGYGAVGSRVGRVLVAFGADVIVSDPYVDGEVIRSDGARPVGLDELLATATVVSLHARLSEETRGMIGAEQVAAMRRGAILVNSARGGLLDDTALPDALHSGHLAAFATDVYDVEPPPADWPLAGVPNVVATPHLAGASRQTAERAARIAAGEVGRWVRGERLAHPANDAAGKVGVT